MEKIKSSKYAAFMNTTPADTTATWSRFGKGISSFPISYSPKSTTEVYIDDDNATTTVDGYEISADTEQVAMKGEPIFDYVDGIREDLKVGSECETEVILASVYNFTVSGNSASGTAKKYGATIIITDLDIKGGEIVKIKYKVALNGTPSDVSVSIAAGALTVTTSGGSGSGGAG